MNFETEFGHEAQAVYGLTGQFNLLGAFARDFGGHVLNLGFSQGIMASAARRDDGVVRIRTINKEHAKNCETIEIDLRDLPRKRFNWRKHVEYQVHEIARELKERGIEMRGADILLGSDIPIEKGLGSSDLLGAVIGYALMDLYGQTPDTPEQRARIAVLRLTEGDETRKPVRPYIESAAALLLRSGKAVLMDCAGPDAPSGFREVPVNLPPEYSFLLIDTGRPRKAYPADEPTPTQLRQAASRLSLETLQALPQFSDRQSLSAFTPEEIAANRRLIDQAEDADEKRASRWALHAAGESERARQSAEALASGDAVRLGQLMSASHFSARYLYDTYQPDLELLRHLLARLPGVLGARMLGDDVQATKILALVDRDKIPELEKAVKERMSLVFQNRPLAFHELQPGGTGPQVLWRQEDHQPDTHTNADVHPGESADPETLSDDNDKISEPDDEVLDHIWPWNLF